MAVTSDKGDSLNVHPTHKQEVGERLAVWALNKTYNYKNVVPSGPLFKSVSFKMGQLIFLLIILRVFMHQITMKFVPLSCPETIKYFIRQKQPL